MAQVSPESGGGSAESAPFKAGGDLDLSVGPVKKRRCTNPEWCIIFIAHICFFWFCAFVGATDGNPWKLVNPRDYQGQYCGIEKQWNGGSSMANFEKALYTLNLTASVEPMAQKFICSSAMQTLLVPSVVTAAEFTDACGSSLESGTLSSITGGLQASLDGYFRDPSALLTGSGGTNILSSFTKYFHAACAKNCGLTSADATAKVTFTPAPDARYYKVWTKFTTNCGNSTSNGCVTDKFQFNALPASLCPYSDRMKCVLIPGVTFMELSSGYCTLKVDTGVLSSVGSALADYASDLAKTGVVSSISGGLDSAIGDIQKTWDVFILVAVLSFVCGLVYLILLRFLVKPVVWISILLVFLLFLVGGSVAILYSGMCKDGEFADAAKTYANTTVNSAATDECGGQYKIQDETNRDILKGCGFVLLVCCALYCLAICCLFSRIRLAISINEVAAMFVFQTPHIILVPVIQSIIGILWCAVWMFLASFLLSQVPEDFVPTTPYADYTTAMGTADTPGKCNGAWPSGFAWHDVTNKDCISSQKCWSCAPPRYIFDYRFAFSFFSFLWHNAFFVACGQCIIAGAVGCWFFRARTEDAKDLAPNAASRKGVCTAVKNAMLWHPGSLAFGSFILAVVQFLRWLMYYISKQAKAQKNKVLEILAKIAGCCLWCFEKCVKFLNKNAYIQVALMSTPFCVSAKNAFFLILRNAARFGVMGMLGSVIRFIGKSFIMVCTGVLGFFLLEALHPDIDTPVILVILYVIIGYFVGATFMNVFGLAVDSTLQCFIATEEMGIPRDFVPERLQKFVNDTAGTDGNAGCCGCFTCCCGGH